MERKEQDRRLKPAVQELQPQKCPRCESINTKFCYYNNYSLSQPRYFCKTCRRYWTQGGTLRNVPVGGGCRKGKRLKTPATASPSSGENSRSQPQSQNLNNLVANNSTANTSLVTGLNSNKESDNTNLVNSPSIGSFNYPGAGFLDSLAAIQQQSLPLNQRQLSNLNLLNGFSTASAPFYPIGNLNWQNFSSSSNLTVPDTALWSISTSTTAANNNNNTNINTTVSASTPVVSYPLDPNNNHWHDLSGYGNSPP